MLELKEVYARYGAITALRGISLQVSQGELVALLGVNGAGKSTTLSCIAGVLKPWQGSINFEGTSLVGKSPEQIARLGSRRHSYESRRHCCRTARCFE